MNTVTADQVAHLFDVTQPESDGRRVVRIDAKPGDQLWSPTSTKHPEVATERVSLTYTRHPDGGVDLRIDRRS